MANPPLVQMHRPEMMSATFERGAFRSLKTGARISYEPANLDEDNGFGGNFRNTLLLDRSVKLLMAAPWNFQPFTSLNRNGEAATQLDAEVLRNNECPFSNLVLVDMQPKMAASNNIVDVEMTYQHIMDGHNQIIINPPSRRLFVKARSNISDKTTNFYQYRGNKAAPRTQLAVAHTFPETDLDITAAPFDKSLPRTVVQTGEINVPFPAKGFSLQGMIFTPDIGRIAEDLVAHINEELLLGQPPGYWICSEFTWEMHNAFPTVWQRGQGAYKVSMEFQYNYDTWDVDVVFVDKRTGQPPSNLQKGTAEATIGGLYGGTGDGVLRMTRNFYNFNEQPAGIWKVPFLPTRNFSQYFGDVRWELVG